MPTLILLRHGQSQWNLEDRFTGWVDVDLTAQGEAEAKKGGELIRAAGIVIDRVFTSVLTRAIRTSWIALHSAGQTFVPEVKDWRLNERHYGSLQGLDKAQTTAKHGEAQVKVWRRSYDIPPPPLAADDPRHPRQDPRYAGLAPSALPGTESLKTTLARVLPYWEERIAPELLRGKNVIVAAHGNSLRALVKMLEGISDEEITELNIPTGVPRLYELDAELGVRHAEYLGDTATIAAAAKAVAEQAKARQ